jgi:hypothetical protein
MKPTIRLTLIAATAIVLVACSSTHSTTPPLGETTRSTMYRKGVPGGIIVETTTLNATVTSIDAANRTVTLAVKDGREKSIKCGPEVINFDQIHIGDHVNATIKSELTMALADAGDLPIGTGVAQVALAPEGDRPGGTMTETQEYIATVVGINLRRREATLRLPDDTTRTFVVRPDVDLSQRKVGEKVAVRVSVVVTIAVQKPQHR